MAELKEKRKDMLKVPVSLIKVRENFNARKEFGEMEELSASIAENGIKVPLRGYKEDGVFYLTDGHRRFEALKQAIEAGAEIEYVPFIPEPKGYTEEERLLDMIVLNSGKDLTTSEKGDVYKRLVEQGMKETEIAKKVGKSTAHISSCITLLEKGSEVLTKAVKDGVIAESSATEIARSTGDKDEQQSIIDKLKADNNVTDSSKNKGKGAKISRTQVKKELKKAPSAEPSKEEKKPIEKVEKPKEEEVENEMTKIDTLVQSVETLEVYDVDSKKVLEDIAKYLKGDINLKDAIAIFAIS